MKTVHLLLLLLIFVCFSACDNDDETPYTGGEFLWTPFLSGSLIADGSVTLQWTKSTDIYTGDELSTKSFITNYIVPDKFEIYQSDQPNDGFTKIAEIKNKNEDVSYKVNNLQNGKTVYFRVKSLRKGYETMESGSYAFIPNPQPESEAVFTSEQLSDQVSALSISPAGKKTAYISIERYGLLCVCNADGTDVQFVENDVHSYFWNHDGSLLYFITGYTSQVKSYNYVTREITFVMNNGLGYSRDWAVSPDGNKVLYNRHQDGNLNLYMYNVETSKDSLLMSRDMGSKGLEHTEPVWIDNENYLVKKINVNTPYTVSLSLISCKDNKEEDLIAEYSYFSHYAILSPDKKHIVYMDNTNHSARLMLYNVETKSIRQLSGYEPNTFIYYINRDLAWKDNQTIYYSEYCSADETWRIVSVSI